MTDLLEHDLRDALAERAALVSPEAITRLQAADYRPRTWQLPARPVLGAVGLSGAAAATAAVLLLGSDAPAAFAGWTADPTAPGPGQLAAAARECSAPSGSPVLTDTRGPYTASIYADGSTCVEGNGTTISSHSGSASGGVRAGTVALNGAGESDSDGHALTMVDGRTGSGVSAVTITRSDGSSVQATVKDGWYLAWWPGSARAVSARVAGDGGTSTQTFPSGPRRPTPTCPAGSHCSTGFGFASGPGSIGKVLSLHSAQHSTP